MIVFAGTSKMSKSISVGKCNFSIAANEMNKKRNVEIGAATRFTKKVLSMPDENLFTIRNKSFAMYLERNRFRISASNIVITTPRYFFKGLLNMTWFQKSCMNKNLLSIQKQIYYN